eukprot:gene316-1141_t
MGYNKMSPPGVVPPNTRECLFEHQVTKRDFNLKKLKKGINTYPVVGVWYYKDSVEDLKLKLRLGVAVIDLMGKARVPRDYFKNGKKLPEEVFCGRCRVRCLPSDITAAEAKEWLDAGISHLVLDEYQWRNVCNSKSGGIPAERVIFQYEYLSPSLEVFDVKRIANLAGEGQKFGGLVIDRAGKVVTDVMKCIADTCCALDLPLMVVYPVCPYSVCSNICEFVAEADLYGVETWTLKNVKHEPFWLGILFASVLFTEREDGLFPTAVLDSSGGFLGMVYSSFESICRCLTEGIGIYHSRRRGIWRKGETSGDTQKLVRLEIDCDRDALAVCFDHQTRGLKHLQETCFDRVHSAPPGSYTKKLIEDPSGLLRAKLIEEAGELADAQTKKHVAEEMADLLYFAMVRCATAGVSLDDVEQVLDRRSLKVTRRPGKAKVVLPNNPLMGACPKALGSAAGSKPSSKRSSIDEGQPLTAVVGS